MYSTYIHTYIHTRSMYVYMCELYVYTYKLFLAGMLLAGQSAMKHSPPLRYVSLRHALIV